MKKILLNLVRKSETREWVVRVRVDGKLCEMSTYYTDDKQDAIDTMMYMAAQYTVKGDSVIARGHLPKPSRKKWSGGGFSDRPEWELGK